MTGDHHTVDAFVDIADPQAVFFVERRDFGRITGGCGYETDGVALGLNRSDQPLPLGPEADDGEIKHCFCVLSRALPGFRFRIGQCLADEALVSGFASVRD